MTYGWAGVFKCEALVNRCVLGLYFDAVLVVARGVVLLVVQGVGGVRKPPDGVGNWGAWSDETRRGACGGDDGASEEWT